MAIHFEIRGRPALQFDIGAVKVIHMGGGEPYRGDYVVTPKADTATTLSTKGKTMLDNVTVQKVPYYETSNDKGYTVYIAAEV